MWFFRKKKEEKPDPRLVQADKEKNEVIRAARKATHQTKKVNYVLDGHEDSVTLNIFLATGGDRRTK